MRVAASRDEEPSSVAAAPRRRTRHARGLAGPLLLVAFSGFAGLVAASLILAAWFFLGRGAAGSNTEQSSRRPGASRDKSTRRTRIRLSPEVAMAGDNEKAGSGKTPSGGNGVKDGGKKNPDRPIRPENTDPDVKEPDKPATSTPTNDKQLCEKLVKSMVWIIGTDGKKQWTGSGAVVHVGRRLIVTNQHVVQSESEVLVLFPKRDAEGEVIPEKKEYIKLLEQAQRPEGPSPPSPDSGRDLAVLQLEGRLPVGTVAVKIAPRPAARAERILLVGNPGLSSALWVPTPGTVRARVSKADTIGYDYRCLETLLGTHGGDSGSPIVNDRCQLVGVHFGTHRAPGSTLKYAADRDEVLAVLGKLDVEKDEVLASDTLPPANAVVLKLIEQIDNPDPEREPRRRRGGFEQVGPRGRPAGHPGPWSVPPERLTRTRTSAESSPRRTRANRPAGQGADLDCVAPIMSMSSKRARLYVVDALGQMGPDARPANSRARPEP